MVPEKISPTLAESLLTQADDSWVDVILELPVSRATDLPGTSRPERIAQLKKDFAIHAEPLVQKIRNMGGEIKGEAWLNNSVCARVATHMIPALTDHIQ